jgi:hypothetical protein
MIITEKERDLIASTPRNECWICEDIINHIQINLRNEDFYISEYYLIENEFIREHLRQIIKR